MKKGIGVLAMVIVSLFLGASSEAEQVDITPGIKIPVKETILIGGQVARFEPAPDMSKSEIFISEKLLYELTDQTINLNRVRQEGFFGYMIPTNKTVSLEGKPVQFQPAIGNDDPYFFVSRKLLNLSE